MYQSINCGKIKFKLKDMMESKNLTKNGLSTKSGVRFDTIQKLYKGTLTRLDLEIVCRLCKALDCSIDDLIEYEK